MSQEEKPKLIIDEDWKTQVEKERAALKSAQTEAVPEPTSQPTEAPQPPSSEQDIPPLPPASFPFLISMLGTQALAAMGQLPDQAGNSTPRLDEAKHFIDLLDVLERKTKGNLESQEYDLLADWLHQLRMTFVAVSKRK